MQASYPFCHVTQLNLISLPLNDAPSAQPQTLSLPDALPISPGPRDRAVSVGEVAMAPVAEAGEPDTSRTGWKTSDMAPLPQDDGDEHGGAQHAQDPGDRHLEGQDDGAGDQIPQGDEGHAEQGPPAQ